MTLITVKREGGKVLWAVEKLVDDDKRFLVVRKQFEDGVQTDDWHPLPFSTAPLLFIPNLADDIDDIAIHDIIQSVLARRHTYRVISRPNLQKMYQDMNEARAAELVGQRHFQAAVPEAQ